MQKILKGFILSVIATLFACGICLNTTSAATKRWGATSGFAYKEAKGGAKPFITLTSDKKLTLTYSGENANAETGATPNIHTSGKNLKLVFDANFTTTRDVDKTANDDSKNGVSYSRGLIRVTKKTASVEIDGGNKTISLKRTRLINATGGSDNLKIEIRDCKFVDCDGDNLIGHVVRCVNSNATITFRNCTFVNCVSHGRLTIENEGNDDDKYVGGGVFKGNCAAMFENCNFTSCGSNATNSSTVKGNHGGAIWLRDGNLKISGGKFSNCYAGSGFNFYYDSTLKTNLIASYANGAMQTNTNSNSANYENNGGAVYLTGDKSELKVYTYYNMEDNEYKPAIFESNGAIHSGGAIYLHDVKKTAFSWTQFTSNQGHNNYGDDANGGGAIATKNSNLECSKCIFNSNKAIYKSGGAIYTNAGGTAGTTKINSCRFVSNTAGQNGGAFATVSKKAVVNITNDGTNKGTYLFENNTATTGGAVFIQGTNSASITNYYVRENYATNGGGIAACGNTTNNKTANIDVSSCEITDNNATSTGGGLYMSASGTMILDSSTVATNKATSGGGGAWVVNKDSKLTIRNSNIRNNEAANGGGVGIGYDSVSGTVQMSTGANINNNTATNGGGVYVGSGGKLAFMAGTIHTNTASSNGGGVYNENNGTVQVYGNTTKQIVGNTATNFMGGGIYNNGLCSLDGSNLGNSLLQVDSNTAGTGKYGAGVYNLGSFMQNSIYSEFICSMNNGSGETAEFYNGNGYYTKAVLRGNSTAANRTMIGSSASTLYAITNKSAFYIYGGTAYYITSGGNNVINNSGTFTIQNTTVGYLDSYNDNGTVINNTGYLYANEDSNASWLRIRGMGENGSDIGLNNTGDGVVRMKAYISGSSYKLNYGIKNTGNVQLFSGDISYTNKHAIQNSASFIGKSADIHHNDNHSNTTGTDNMGAAMYLTGGETTLYSSTIRDNGSRYGVVNVTATAKLYLSDSATEKSKSGSDKYKVSNIFKNNAGYNGGGTDIHINKKGYVRDFSTAYMSRNTAGSLVDRCVYMEAASDDKGTNKPIYEVGYNTCTIKNGTKQPFINILNGDYIDVVEPVSGTVEVEGVTYINNRLNVVATASNAGRIIANGKEAKSSRFRSIAGENSTTENYPVRDSSKLNDDNKNKLFTQNGNDNITKNSNINSETLYCSGQKKNEQVFLSRTYKVNYYPVSNSYITEKGLTKAQIEGITWERYTPAGVKQINDASGNATNMRYYTDSLPKYWGETLQLTSNVRLNSNFATFSDTGSWVTLSGVKYARYDYYNQDADLDLYAVWKDGFQIVVCHHLMSAAGELDEGMNWSKSSPISLRGSGNSYVYLVSMPGTRTGTYAMGCNKTNDEFKTWAQLTSVANPDDINEDYINENLIDNNLYRTGITYVSKTKYAANVKIVDIYYSREQHTITLKGDSDLEKLEIMNPFVYYIKYDKNSRTTSVTQKRTADHVDDNNMLEIKRDITVLPSNTSDITPIRQSACVYLKEGVPYTFDLRFSTAGTNDKVVVIPANEDNTYTGESGGYELAYTSSYKTRATGTFTAGSTGYYRIVCQNNKEALWEETPDIDQALSSITAYGDLLGDVETTSNFNEGIKKTFYATVEEEFDTMFHLKGVSTENRRLLGLYKENEDGFTLTKVPDTYDEDAKQHQQYPTWITDNVTQKTIVNKNKDEVYWVKRNSTVDVKSYNETLENYNDTLTQPVDNSHRNIFIPNSIVSASEIFSYFTSNPTKSNYASGATVKMLQYKSASDYVPTKWLTLTPEDIGDGKLYNMNGVTSFTFNYGRLRYTITVKAGDNAKSVYINRDNNSTGEVELTNKFALDSIGASEFGLSVENPDDVYIGGKLYDEALEPQWSADDSSYNTTYKSAFKNLSATITPLKNANVTITLKGNLDKTVTINHYLMDVDGEGYSLKNTVEYDKETANNTNSINLNNIKDNNIIVHTNETDVIYFDRANYRSMTYTGGTISFDTYDKHVVVNLYYDRVDCPVQVYANKYIDNVRARYARPTRATYSPEGENKLLTTITVKYGDTLHLTAEEVEGAEGYDIEYGGYSKTAADYNGNNLTTSEKQYEYTPTSPNNNAVTVMANRYDWKWDVVYHANAEIDGEDNVVGKKYLPEDVSYSVLKENSLNKSYLLDEKPAVDDEIFAVEDYSFLRYVDTNGNKYNPGDELDYEKLKEAGVLDNDHRRIDLYAEWKNENPQINMYAEDLYYEVGTNITKDMILDKVLVSNGKGELLSNSESKLGVVKVEVSKEHKNLARFPKNSLEYSDTNLAEDNYPDVFDSKNPITYITTVKATNKVDKETTKDGTVASYYMTSSPTAIDVKDYDYITFTKFKQGDGDPQSGTMFYIQSNKSGVGDGIIRPSITIGDKIDVKDYDTVYFSGLGPAGSGISAEYTLTGTKEKKVTSAKAFKVHVYENTVNVGFVRAISMDFLQTLSLDSTWREPAKFARLQRTLHKGSDNDAEDRAQARYIYTFTADEMESMKESIKDNNYKYKKVVKDSNVKKKPE